MDAIGLLTSWDAGVHVLKKAQIKETPTMKRNSM